MTIDRDRIATLQVSAEIAELVTRGRVSVVRADAPAGDTLVNWGDWPGVTPWQTWARPAAERRGVAVTWDAVTSSPERLAASGPQISLLWREACEREAFPALLSIVGAPSDNSGTLRSPLIDALAGAIKRADSGLVIITNPGAPAWALARCLPAYAGDR